MKVALGYFDPIVGPLVFYSYPDKIEAGAAENIARLMDMGTINQFYRFEETENHRVFINYLFHLPSGWGRGKVELVMISAILDSNLDLLSLEYLFKRIAERMQSESGLYKAFYVGKKQDREITEKNQSLIGFLNQFHREIQEKVDQILMIDRFFTKRPITPQTSERQMELAILNTFITTIDGRTPQGSILLHTIGANTARQFAPILKGTDYFTLTKELKDFWAQQSFGRIDDMVEAPDGFSFRVYGSFECIQYPDIGQTMCKFHEGFFGTIFRLRINDKIIVKETECLATGDEYCRFVVWVLP
jgi:predicted hydrocarbon binding protein